MKLTLRRPCQNCPFRNDIRPYLNKERASEIVEGLESGSTFPCHKTIDYEKRADLEEQGASRQEIYREIVKGTQQCAGALIMFQKHGRAFQMAQIAERLGLHDPSRLEMDSPVYESPKDFIDAQDGR